MPLSGRFELRTTSHLKRLPIEVAPAEVYRVLAVRARAALHAVAHDASAAAQVLAPLSVPAGGIHLLTAAARATTCIGPCYYACVEAWHTCHSRLLFVLNSEGSRHWSGCVPAPSKLVVNEASALTPVPHRRGAGLLCKTTSKCLPGRFIAILYKSPGHHLVPSP